MPKKAKVEDSESEVLDAMITSLAELLEEKGVITQAEWEQRIKKNLKS
jgi:hypothetical protein